MKRNSFNKKKSYKKHFKVLLLKLISHADTSMVGYDFIFPMFVTELWLL